MNDEIDKQLINASELYKLITNEMVHEAISYINKNNLVLKDAAKYYLLIDEFSYPPKEVVRIIAKLNNYELNEGSLNGGQANKPFQKLGFQIINKKDYPIINGSRFQPQIRKYQEIIDNTEWLSKNEGYKFHFSKWFEENINIHNQTNDEIIAKINESQELLFQPNSKDKGVNFIKSIKRFKDDYIIANDLDKIRQIIDGNLDVTKENLTLSFNSFSKSSVYLNLFSPEYFTFYDSKSSPSYEFLSERKDYPKKDFNAFIFNQLFYKMIKRMLKDSHLDTNIFKKLLEVDELNELHWNFITQDFLFFIAEKIMKKDTLQDKYNQFLENVNLSEDDWYINLKKYSELLNIIKANSLANQYKNYKDLNDDFKLLAQDSNEDFLQRYLFESNNGFSKIRNQLIENNIREVIRKKVNNDYTLLHNVLICSDKKDAYQKIHQLIESNKWAVITRFTRALFPYDFTSIDSKKFFDLLLKKLNDDFEIEFDTKDQIDLNQQIMNLIEFEDVYNAQIFFWNYTTQTYDLDNLNDSETEGENEINNTMKNIHPLNQILYGAPGTGKTHETKKIAVEIIENEKLDHLTRDQITSRYDFYFDKGQINFTTFHQSISYEDFIEGIKPQVISDENENKSVIYDIEDGIFKKMCQLSATTNNHIIKNQNINFENLNFFKMSLGGINNLDLHNWSFENNLLVLGWGDDRDFTNLSKIKDWKLFRDQFKKDFPELVNESKYVIQAVFIFQRMKVGDIVFVSKGNKIIDAVGIVESEYFYDSTKEIDKYQFRKVKWLATNLNIPAEKFLNVKITQASMYEFNKKDVKINDLTEYFSTNKIINNNHVIIIDEINRGNVSAIFGELITLIEDTKRKGTKEVNKETIEVELPYSKTKFTVPDNLFIIGTMNTADRSVEALDTALRRRFSFIEMKSNPEVLKKFHNTNGIITTAEGYTINLIKLLEKINQRIEVLIDKDHQIGHSFFINISTLEELQLVFKNKINPLLEEYFFGNFAKIGLVLGEDFFEEAKSKGDIFAKFNYDDRSFLNEKIIYQLKDTTELKAEDFGRIYK